MKRLVRCGGAMKAFLGSVVVFAFVRRFGREAWKTGG